MTRAPVKKKESFRVTPSSLARAAALVADSKAMPVNPFALPEHPPQATPKQKAIAQDDALVGQSAWAAGQWAGFPSAEGVAFVGFTLLADLSQRPEYRRIVETIASEMTRRWIRLTAKGNEDKSEKLKAIQAEMDRLKVRQLFRKAIECDGYFGRGHIFIDFGDTSETELQTSIGDGGEDSKAKVGRDKLHALRAIEAIWVYPQGYDTTNPLSPHWYAPSTWYVMGRAVHHSRILTLIGREVPDLLKPSYSFGGLSLTQIAKPYVENWLRTRQSVADLIAAFSVSGIKTDLQDAEASGDAGADLVRRVSLFNMMRSNLGSMVLNKDEEFFNVSTPLGTLDKLQAQSQEQMCSVSQIPLVKFTGITPTGLNASSEGEIRVFDDHIHGTQEHMCRAPLTKLLNLIQISKFGEVDPDIGFEFEHLYNLDEKERAEVREIEARTGETLVRTGAITRDEERSRVANDQSTPYPGLNLDEPVPASDSERVDNGVKVGTLKIAAHEAGLTAEADALRGLAETGLFPEITPAVIYEADADPPKLGENGSSLTLSELGG